MQEKNYILSRLKRMRMKFVQGRFDQLCGRNCRDFARGCGSSEPAMGSSEPPRYMPFSSCFCFEIILGPLIVNLVVAEKL